MGRQLPHEAAKSSWGGMPKWLNSAVSHILQTAPWASYRPMGTSITPSTSHCVGDERFEDVAVEVGRALGEFIAAAHGP